MCFIELLRDDDFISNNMIWLTAIWILVAVSIFLVAVLGFAYLYVHLFIQDLFHPSIFEHIDLRLPDNRANAVQIPNDHQSRCGRSPNNRPMSVQP